MSSVSSRLKSLLSVVITGALIVSSQTACLKKSGASQNSSAKNSEKPQTTEEITMARAKENYEELKGKYLKDHGVYSDGKLVSVTLDVDNWRDYFPEYKGTNAGDVHEASSYCSQRFFDELLKDMRGVGNETVVVLAGGGGSGKGTATKPFVEAGKSPIVLDQVMSKYSRFTEVAQKIKEAGFKVNYVFVDRDPSEAWKGIIQRAVGGRERGGIARTVPLQVAVPANLEARKVAAEILEKNPDIPATIIDNNLGAGLARVIDDKTAALAFLKSKSYDEAKLLKELENETIGLYESGKIPADIAAGLIGEEAISSRRVQP